MNTRRQSRDEVEAVRAANPIEQVIASYIELKPSGRRLVGHCPFHEDRDPSLVVYVHNQSWYCFGCNVGGDVFDFVKRIENIGFAEALKLLSGSRSMGAGYHVATSRRVVPPPPPMPETPALELGEEHFTLLTAATEVYHAALFTRPDLLEYLAKRGVDMDMVRRFRIGYAAGDSLARYFRFRGWDPEIAKDLGLLVPREGNLREYFRERIVIPELREGRAIYLVGRATQGWQKAKYLTLAGVPKPLYGVELIRGANEVFVAEGPFDWLALIKWGYPAVAVLGSHLKREHEKEFAVARRIYMVTQSDEASRRLGQQLKEVFGARAIVLPPLSTFRVTRDLKDVSELLERHPQDGHDIFARVVRYAAEQRRAR